MSRTIIRYGPEDIDKGNPVHGFIMAVVLVSVLKFTAITDEEPVQMMDRIVSDILNMATEQGISLSKSEIPAAFLQT